MTSETGRHHDDDTIDVDGALLVRNGAPLDHAPVVSEAPTNRPVAGSAMRLRLTAVFIMIVVAGTGAGYLGVILLPTQYAARAEVQYNLTQASPNALLREDRTLTTQLVLLRSRVVLDPVAAEYRMSPETLADHVSADVVDGSEIIRIQVTDRTRERAQAILTAVIDRYMTLTNKEWKDPILSYLEGQLGATTENLQSPDAQNTGEPLQRVKVLRDLLGELKQSPPEDQTHSGSHARVLTPPYRVAAQVSPTPTVGATTGAAAAAVIAAFVILVAARRRSKM